MRNALITGVGRPNGIGYAVALRLAAGGHRLALHAHEEDAPRLEGAVHIRADFIDPAAPERVVAEAADALGHLDVLVVNHARSVNQGLGELDAAEIDAALAVNVRASLLLVEAFEKRHDGRPGGRIVMMTSGQHRGPMPGELPYIAGKGALHQLTPSLAAAVAPKRITVNTVDPGATDTGWPTREIREWVLERQPFGRWGQPEDAARLIAFLCSEDAAWVTGQVITSAGGGP
ncbi:SDR family oxidoreductase [Candidatus Solirubrobacter pratensis]|uniref:SDR family oxidoreductase n=1 Tax=Candidatus Solirubrobacter pratensis TaxID=1298857 RepID=UPI00041A7A38|nr:SDR family oxidoreductase [Candidatus Solirubrobacter pratensis]